MRTSSQYAFEVQGAEAGARLDTLLRAHQPGLSRRLMADLFARGQVLLDGLPAGKGLRARTGQKIVVSLPPADRAQPNPELALRVIAEATGYVIVDKPAGQPCMPLSGEETHCTANALVARYPEMAAVGYGPREPGLVHRLDNDTSGVLLAARTAQAFARLKAALRDGTLKKEYLAIASTPPKESGVIELALGPSTTNSAKVQVLQAGGKAASSTHYRVLSTAAGYSLLLVTVGRAYRHQVRVHLASIGSPLVGDALYGGSPALPHHALHAHRLAYAGDDAVPSFDVRVELPQQLSDWLRRAARN